MKTKTLISLGAVICLLLGIASADSSNLPLLNPLAPDLVYYDAVRDFSTVNNPTENGWKYGWSEDLTGAFVLYIRSSMPGINNGLEIGWDDPSNSNGFTPSVAINSGPDFDDGNVTFSAGALIQHPCGIDGHAVSHVIWTAPQKGNYFVTCNFIAQQYNVSVDVHVLVRGVSVFDSTVTHIDQYRNFTGVVHLRAGDQIDFAVGPNGSFSLHPGNTGFQAIIVPTR